MIVTSRKLIALLGTAALVTLTGCVTTTVNGSGEASSSIAAKPTAVAQGYVRSGQLVVSGASVKLYAVSSAGYGAASTSLLQKAVTTGSDGGFTIANDYTCPANALVYVVATGGSFGVAGAQSASAVTTPSNSALAMMTGLGPCSSLTSSTAIQVNELTTVASVWALSGFMSSSTAVGTTSTNVHGLTNAFAAINKIVSVSAGRCPVQHCRSVLPCPARI